MHIPEPPEWFVDSRARKTEVMAQALRNDTERYKKAMDLAFQQIDWCIGYLHGIRKTKISQALARNRLYIAEQIANEREIKVPTDNAEAARE